MFGIDWSTVTITNDWLTKDKFAVNRIMKYKRDNNSGRDKDPSYELERTFLNAIESKNFTHRTYELEIFGLDHHLLLQFTPNEVILGYNW